MTGATTILNMIARDPNLSPAFAKVLDAVGIRITGPASGEQDGYRWALRVDPSYRVAVYRFEVRDRGGNRIASGGASSEHEARLQATEEIGRRIDAERHAFADDRDVLCMFGPGGDYVTKHRG